MRIINARHDGVRRLDPTATRGRIDEVIELVDTEMSEAHGVGLRHDTEQESRELLEAFCWQWSTRGAVSPALLEWASACFDAMLERGGMRWPERPPHRPPRNAARDLELARRVHALIASGTGRTEAYEAVAAEAHKDGSVVGKIYRDCLDKL